MCLQLPRGEPTLAQREVVEGTMKMNKIKLSKSSSTLASRCDELDIIKIVDLWTIQNQMVLNTMMSRAHQVLQLQETRRKL